MKDQNRSQFDIVISVTIVALVIFLDRVTKKLFSETLSVGESIPIIKDVLHMSLVHNTGIAFGFLRDQGVALIIIPSVFIIWLIVNMYYYRRNDEALSHMYIVGFSLIIAGAIGNLIDRIAFGYVIDFIDFRIWPVFNIADSAITVGAGIIAFKCFKLSSTKK